MTKLKELRKEHKLSMKELGKILGLSESTISLYEAGKREPDIKTLIKIADYFNVSVDVFHGSVLLEKVFLGVFFFCDHIVE